MNATRRSESIAGSTVKLLENKPTCRGLLPVIFGLSVGIAGCTGTENPQLAMCKKVIGNLAGSVSNWDKTDVSEQSNNMTVKASYTLAAGASGNASCLYKRDQSDRDAIDPPFDTAPYKVTVNGEAIPTKQLISAGFKASKEALSEVAVETSKQAKKNAALASEKASEVAEKVGEMSEEANRRTEAFAEEAGEKARELGDKAVKATKEAVDKAQKALEN